MVLLQRKRNFPKDPEGVQLFPGGGGGGGGGSKETHITCDFPGGVQTPTPYPPSGSAYSYIHIQIHIITRYLIKGLYSSTTNSNREI